MDTGYAELYCWSNFSFLQGASFPEELIERASQLGYQALALTDECSVAGVVRGHEAAKKHRFPLIVGSSFTTTCNLRFIALAPSRPGYAALCRLITQARRAAVKGSYALTRAMLEDALADCLMIWLPDRGEAAFADGRWLHMRFADRLWIGVELHHDGEDAAHIARTRALAMRLHLPVTACGGVADA